MFNFFRKKNGHPRTPPRPAVELADLDGRPLQEGDLVECLRYDLGRCKVIVLGTGYGYESLTSGAQVS